MSYELKIKSKHLAEEAKIIRHEERKALKSRDWHVAANAGKVGTTGNWIESRTFHEQYLSLHKHRVHNVRDEQRATFLARAFIEGRSFAGVETDSLLYSEQMGVFVDRVLPRFIAMVCAYGAVRKRLPSVAEKSAVAETLQKWMGIDPSIQLPEAPGRIKAAWPQVKRPFAEWEAMKEAAFEAKCLNEARVAA